jgi:opacity protein-like surface antigen
LLEGGPRHYREQTNHVASTTDATMVGVKRGVKVFNKTVQLGASYEQGIRDVNRQHSSLSPDLSLTKDTALYAKYESGHDFSSVLGSNAIARSDRLVVGAKHKVSPSMETYSEYRHQALTGADSAETATGFRGNITVEKGLTVTPALEIVKVSKGDVLQDSFAGSVIAKDVRDANNKKYIRAEVRQGENDKYYALEGNYVKRIDDVWSAYVGEKLRVTQSNQDGTNGSHELTLGLAQRPRDAGTHNGLYLYQWKEQRGAGENAESSTHILSTHQHYRSDAALLDGKTSYAINDKVDVYARAGVIASNHFNERHYSTGIGANVTVDKNLRVGIGYNNSGFNDQDLDPDQQNKNGFFVNLILKANENMFDWLN